MDNVCIHVPARKMTEFSIFSINSALRQYFSEEWHRFLDIFSKNSVTFEVTQIVKTFRFIICF
jgi:hypothetical protein